ncbi:MAG: hypothetical protein HDT21_00255 [Ruminococcus sp.]|nr:hypothetical protein [Ruminococcus sp.]
MEEYAYFLKDVYGRKTFYRRYKNEVAYMPPKRCPSDNDVFRRTKIDVNTMEVLDRIFIKDSQRVYRMGYLLKGIDPSDFHIFNCAYMGNHQVIYTPYGDAEVAHPEAFEALDEGGFTQTGRKFPDGVLFAEGKNTEDHYYCHSYGRDGEFVYFFTEFTQTRKAVRLKACHTPETFEVLAMEYMFALAKDNKHVYYEDHTVKNADCKTVEYIGDGYWRDSRHVFFHGHVVDGADVDSFRIIEPEHIVKRADADVFRKIACEHGIIGGGHKHKIAVAADKNHYYKFGKIFDEYEQEQT